MAGRFLTRLFTEGVQLCFHLRPMKDCFVGPCVLRSDRRWPLMGDIPQLPPISARAEPVFPIALEGSLRSARRTLRQNRPRFAREGIHDVPRY